MVQFSRQPHNQNVTVPSHINGEAQSSSLPSFFTHYFYSLAILSFLLTKEQKNRGHLSPD